MTSMTTIFLSLGVALLLSEAPLLAASRKRKAPVEQTMQPYWCKICNKQQDSSSNAWVNHHRTEHKAQLIPCPIPGCNRGFGCWTEPAAMVSDSVDYIKVISERGASGYHRIKVPSSLCITVRRHLRACHRGE